MLSFICAMDFDLLQLWEVKRRSQDLKYYGQYHSALSMSFLLWTTIWFVILCNNLWSTVTLRSQPMLTGFVSDCTLKPAAPKHIITVVMKSWSGVTSISCDHEFSFQGHGRSKVMVNCLAAAVFKLQMFGSLMAPVDLSKQRQVNSRWKIIYNFIFVDIYKHMPMKHCFYVIALWNPVPFKVSVLLGYGHRVVQG